MALIAKEDGIHSLKMDNEISSRSNYQNVEKHGALNERPRETLKYKTLKQKLNFLISEHQNFSLEC
jgi:hypothetical protein